MTYPRSRRHFDPLVPTVAVISLIAFLARGLDGFINRDSGLYFYAGQQVADGHLPYVQAFNRSGPGAHLTPAIPVVIARLLGIDELATARWFYALVGVAVVTLTYLVARHLFGRWPALVAPAALLGTEIFVKTSTRGFSDKLVVTMIALAAVVLLLHGRWLLAGLTIGIAGITWQPVLFAVAPAAAVIALLVGPAAWSAKLRRLGLLALGGATPLAVCVAVYAAAGRLQLFLDCFLLVNSKSATPRTVTSRASDALRLAEVGLGSAAAVLVGAVGAVMIVALAVQKAASADARSTPAGATLIGLGVYTVTGAIWTMIDFDSGADLMILLPAMGLGLSGLASVVAGAMPTRAGQVLCVVLLVACLLPFALRFPERNQPVRVDQQRDVSQTVVDALPRDATVLSIEAPQAQALTGLTNPTRFQLYGRFVADYLDRRTPGGYRAYRERLRRSHPAAVVTGTGPVPPWVQRMLREDGYTRVASVIMLRFWVADEYADSVRTALDRN